ncbi:MAG: sulfatase-like hydrolase/transferase, partial [Akkermansiaceae bacterium]|nr:sulfatase-like hydrolase/transferase [Akkermansiaceae bacterium]
MSQEIGQHPNLLVNLRPDNPAPRNEMKPLALCFLLACCLSSLAPAKPNIILCMADDLGWGDTGFNGHPHIQTPHLDAMAKAGVK